MRILSNQLREDLLCGTPLRLDLGSGGPTNVPGFYAVDLLPLDGVDAVADFNEPLTELSDNSVEALHSRHSFEHVQEFLPLMREIYRISKPGARIEIIVPHFSNVFGFSDPTHVRFFGLYTMNYFVAPEDQPAHRRVPAFYSDVRFKIKSIRIEFYKSGWIDQLVTPILNRWVNRSFGRQEFYERRLSGLFHAWQLRYVMEPDKQA